jgi:hypothetical protein
MSALDQRVVERGFLFGDRPSAADMAFYGQLTQLATDPTPQALMRDHYPWLFRWVQITDDLSGDVEGQWDEDFDSPALRALLVECATHYLPCLDANAAAVQQGQATFSYRAGGVELSQPTDRYQAKCLKAVQSAFADLDHETRARLEHVLSETGCLSLLNRDGSEGVAA